MNYKFAREFNQIKKELGKSRKVLLVAHSRPDGDTAGSVFVLKEYLVNNLKKEATVVCPDPLPEYLKDIFADADFASHKNIDTSEYDLLIGCDAVERSFEKIVKEKKNNQKIILFDHHPAIELKKTEPDIIVAGERTPSGFGIFFFFFFFFSVSCTKKKSAVF